jgi:creatinine amidohydrolase
MTKNGCIGDASKASKEIGQHIVEESLDNLTEELNKLLNLKADIPY